jgi:hypothetical protein
VRLAFERYVVWIRIFDCLCGLDFCDSIYTIKKCEGFVMCGCFGNMYTLLWLKFFLTWLRFFRAFFLSCKTNARVKLAKTGHGPHSSTLVVICVVRLLFVLFCVLFVCKYVLPPGDNPFTVNKNISYKKKACSRNHCCLGRAIGITYSVCVCSCLSYPASKAHLLCSILYCHLWAVRLHYIFPHYLLYTTRFSKTRDWT